MERRPGHPAGKPRGPRTVIGLLFASCLVALAADLFYQKHGHYGFEEFFGFHAWFGFVTFFLLVLAGKHLRKLLMRDEDYYDR